MNMTISGDIIRISVLQSEFDPVMPVFVQQKLVCAFYGAIFWIGRVCLQR
jgi:hypothetical protein